MPIAAHICILWAPRGPLNPVYPAHYRYALLTLPATCCSMRPEQAPASSQTCSLQPQMRFCREGHFIPKAYLPVVIRKRAPVQAAQGLFKAEHWLLRHPPAALAARPAPLLLGCLVVCRPCKLLQPHLQSSQHACSFRLPHLPEFMPSATPVHYAFAYMTK